MSRQRRARRSQMARRPRIDRVELAVVSLALLVRLPGLTWGLPDATHFFSWHPDEYEIAGRAIRMLNTGDPHPEFFNYGSLTLYLTALLALPAKLLGWVQTVTGTHVVGRLLGIACGAATAVVTMRIARHLRRDGSTAMLAGVFVALAPSLVLHSAWITVDVPATFFAALTLLFAIRAAEHPAPRFFALAGALAGLAAGAKYNVGLVLVAPVMAAWLGTKRRPRLAGLAIGAALVAFLISTPYALLDFASFRRDVSYELFQHAQEGHRNYFVSTGTGWSHHLLGNLPYVLGPPLLLLALAGLVVLARRRRPAALILLGFGLGYFALIGFSSVRFLRYVLPIVPVLAVAAAEAAAALRERNATLARAAVSVTVAWLVVLVTQQILAIVAPDPRQRAAEWLDANSEPGVTVALAHQPWFYTPPITPWNGGPRARSRFDATAEQPGRWRLRLVEDWNREALREMRPAFIVMSEFEWREERRLADEEATAFLDDLDRGWELAARFEGLPAARRWTFGGYAPHDWLYPFAEVRVWQRR